MADWSASLVKFVIPRSDHDLQVGCVLRHEISAKSKYETQPLSDGKTKYDKEPNFFAEG